MLCWTCWASPSHQKPACPTGHRELDNIQAATLWIRICICLEFHKETQFYCCTHFACAHQNKRAVCQRCPSHMSYKFFLEYFFIHICIISLQYQNGMQNSIKSHSHFYSLMRCLAWKWTYSTCSLCCSCMLIRYCRANSWHKSKL